ncbi:MAG: peptidoglycan DD-metalloendopeptidase family protein [Oscillospiraceae bacterium]
MKERMQLRKGILGCKIFRTTIASLLITLLFSTVGLQTVHAATLYDVKKEQEALESQKKENEALLLKLQGNTQNKEQYQAAIQAQIVVVQKQMDLYIAEINTIDDEIKKVQQKKSVLSDTPGGGSIMRYDRDLAFLADKRSTLQVVKQDMEYKSRELAALYEEAKVLVKDADQNEKAAVAEAERIARERKKTDAAIDEWYASYREAQIAVGNVSSENLGGDVLMGTDRFQWPVPGYTEITQYFLGDHRGIDISGSEIYGKAIVAADAGTVAYADVMGTYGNVVFLDHGNGYQTRYAHMSALGCEEGDKVAAGQIIGYVGSTGNSTGPHLHFEILYNGNINNPFNYF